ncbi:hypothetical protein NBRC116493_18340 [Aurantivibrio infirmus]
MKKHDELKARFEKLEGTRIAPFGLKRFLWRIFGRLGNTFFKKYPPTAETTSGRVLLNLGAGGNLVPGFVNADFYRLHKIFSMNRSDWMLDITKPFKCKSKYWDGVFIEHTNEHISYSQNLVMLSEVFRTLKPGGTLRIVVPDLDKYLEWGLLRKSEVKMNRYASLPEAISNLTQNHLHMSVWNFDLLREVLSSIGFVDIVKSQFGGSCIEEFTDRPNHKWQSLYLEAKRP